MALPTVSAHNALECVNVMVGAGLCDAFQTPLFDSLFEPRARALAYVMMGRLLYDLHEHEHWELSAVCVGEPRAQQALLRVLHAVFALLPPRSPPHPSSRLISDDAPPMFLESALGARLLVLRRTFLQDQSLWCALNAGELVTIQRLAQRDAIVQWRTPLLCLATPHELERSGWPGGARSADSVLRRACLLRLMHVPPMHPGVVEDEAALLLPKLQGAYARFFDAPVLSPHAVVVAASLLV